MSANNSVELKNRIIAATMVAVPLQFVFLFLAGILMELIRWIFPSFFSFSWVPSQYIPSAVSDFGGILAFGISIYIVNVICYIVFVAAMKVKLRYELLSTLAISFIILALYNATRRRRGHFDFLGLEQGLTDTYLTSMTMFAVFTLSAVLLDKFSEMREWIKILLTFVLALIGGSGLSFLIWRIFL